MAEAGVIVVVAGLLAVGPTPLAESTHFLLLGLDIGMFCILFPYGTLCGFLITVNAVDCSVEIVERLKSLLL